MTLEPPSTVRRAVRRTTPFQNMRVKVQCLRFERVRTRPDTPTGGHVGRPLGTLWEPNLCMMMANAVEVRACGSPLPGGMIRSPPLRTMLSMRTGRVKLRLCSPFCRLPRALPNFLSLKRVVKDMRRQINGDKLLLLRPGRCWRVLISIKGDLGGMWSSVVHPRSTPSHS